MRGSENTSDKKVVKKKKMQEESRAEKLRGEVEVLVVKMNLQFTLGLYSRLIKNRANIPHSNRMSTKVVYNWIKKV